MNRHITLTTWIGWMDGREKTDRKGDGRLPLPPLLYKYVWMKPPTSPYETKDLWQYLPMKLWSVTQWTKLSELSKVRVPNSNIYTPRYVSGLIIQPFKGKKISSRIESFSQLHIRTPFSKTRGHLVISYYGCDHGSVTVTFWWNKKRNQATVTCDVSSIHTGYSLCKSTFSPFFPLSSFLFIPFYFIPPPTLRPLSASARCQVSYWDNDIKIGIDKLEMFGIF